MEWRIELQLKVSRGTDDSRPLIPESLEGFNARGVRRHEFRQIEFEQYVAGTGTEQLRDLRNTEPASQPDDPSIGLLHDTYPAIHGVLRGKTQATTGERGTGRNTEL